MRFWKRLRQYFPFQSKRIIYGEITLLTLLCLLLLCQSGGSPRAVLSTALRLAAGPDASGSGASDASPAPGTSSPQTDYIKWVDFTVPYEALNKAFRYDVDTCQAPVHLNWVNLLAYLGALYGGDFSKYSPKDLDAADARLTSGEITIEELTKDMKYYPYYREAYGAVLDGMVGQFQAEIPKSEAPGAYLPSGVDGGAPGDPETIWVTKYGLKAFFPLAKGFPYTDYDDFGASRSYGYKRRHLGHDMMGQVGTPIIAVESGYVEAMGWNQYGGWRLGIRSLDKKRYYYYAHLRQNYPYQSGLKEGSLVQAGDVIGYLGRTGYSAAENTNNIETAHLHFGLELIFDESQKDSENEIWVDCYDLVQFLRMNQSEVYKVEGTKEWKRKYGTKDTPAGQNPSGQSRPGQPPSPWVPAG